MIRNWSVILVMFLALFMCASRVGAEDALSRAEALEAKGGMDNLKEAVQSYKQAAEETPQSYEARWKGARACRRIAKKAKLEKLEGWKDLCAEYGKQGMELAAEAVELRPEGMEGNFYYGVCVGSCCAEPPIPEIPITVKKPARSWRTTASFHCETSRFPSGKGLSGREPVVSREVLLQKREWCSPACFVTVRAARSAIESPLGFERLTHLFLPPVI